MPWLVVFSIIATGLGVSYLVMTSAGEGEMALKVQKLAFRNLQTRVKCSQIQRRKMSNLTKHLPSWVCLPPKLLTMTITIVKQRVRRIICFLQDLDSDATSDILDSRIVLS